MPCSSMSVLAERRDASSSSRLSQRILRSRSASAGESTGKKDKPAPKRVCSLLGRADQLAQPVEQLVLPRVGIR